MQRFEMVGKGRALVGKPHEDSLIALKNHPLPVSESEASNDLVDQLLFAGRVEGRRDFGIIMDPHGD